MLKELISMLSLIPGVYAFKKMLSKPLCPLILLRIAQECGSPGTGFVVQAAIFTGVESAHGLQ
jgi:hypothetical protein